MPFHRRHALLLLAAVAATGTAGAAELEIVNSSARTIEQLFVVPAGGRQMGPNLLRERQPRLFGRGQNHLVADLAPGAYDLHLEDVHGAECKIPKVAVTTTARVVLTDAVMTRCSHSN